MRMLFALTTALLMACTGGGEPATPGDAGKAPTTSVGAEIPEANAGAYDLNIPTVKYSLDPDAGDKSVPAELGGPGFTGEGWETNLEFPAIGMPGAPKGGELREYIADWPATLRQTGKDWNTDFNYRANAFCYQGLIQVHPTTLEYIPSLASHWQISEDKQTYRYRINPRARWSDGSEVTADDVVASWKLRVDPGILDPSANVYYGRLNEPVAVSKYIVEVTVKEESWRNFLAFGGMSIFPAAEIGISGEQYLDDYQFKYTASSGPYIVKNEDIVTGQTIAMTRRADWWDADNPAWDGVFNIDRYEFTVVKNPDLAYEKIKKGELDYFVVPKAQWWAEEIPDVEGVKRGLLVPRKFYNDAPIGTSGIAINMERPPLDDLNIRKALQLLHDRKTMIEKLYFNEYKPLTSYWQGGTYMNPNNKLIEYDEFGAVELLEKSGWTEINEEGYRVKDGKVLGFSLVYRSALSERSLTIFQEACKRAGIKIELQQLTPASAWKNLREKEYELMSTAWGAIIFPNPESSWHSKYADQKDTNNVTAFADPEVDKLIEEYDKEYDVNRRIELMREIDGLVYNQFPYVLEWYLPAQRVLYRNKYGMPEWGVPRTVDSSQMHMIWWVDPDLEKQLDAARADKTLTMEADTSNNTFWVAWNEAQQGG
jgi:microcin C transport system substrate-binding protein